MAWMRGGLTRGGSASGSINAWAYIKARVARIVPFYYALLAIFLVRMAVAAARLLLLPLCGVLR
jgi:hypothetical protein